MKIAPPDANITPRGGVELKILVINKFCPLHPRAGGAEKNLLEIFSRIGEKHNVYLSAAMFPGARREEIYRNIHIFRFGKPDSENIVRIHLLLPFLTGKYLKIFRPDVLFEDMSVLPLFTPLLYPRQKKIIMIHNLNRGQFFKSQRFFYALIGYLAEGLFLFLYRKEKVIVVSEWMKKALLKHHFQNVFKILNGVDENLLNVKKEYAPEPIVLFLGRLENRKGIDLFLKTYPLVKEKIPSVKYLVAGREFQHYLHSPDIDPVRNSPPISPSGAFTPLEAKASNGARSAGEISNGVEFLGYVSEEEKQKLLSKTWLYVAPSRIEGYGISVIEANATGTFVIANNVEGLRESVINNETGVLTNCFNPQIFAKTIIERLNVKKLQAEEYSCRTWATKHNWDESSKKLEDLIFKQAY